MKLSRLRNHGPLSTPESGPQSDTSPHVDLSQIPSKRLGEVLDYRVAEVARLHDEALPLIETPLTGSPEQLSKGAKARERNSRLTESIRSIRNGQGDPRILEGIARPDVDEYQVSNLERRVKSDRRVLMGTLSTSGSAQFLLTLWELGLALNATMPIFNLAAAGVGVTGLSALIGISVHKRHDRRANRALLQAAKTRDEVNSQLFVIRHELEHSADIIGDVVTEMKRRLDHPTSGDELPPRDVLRAWNTVLLIGERTSTDAQEQINQLTGKAHRGAIDRDWNDITALLMVQEAAQGWIQRQQPFSRRVYEMPSSDMTLVPVSSLPVIAGIRVSRSLPWIPKLSHDAAALMSQPPALGEALLLQAGLANPAEPYSPANVTFSVETVAELQGQYRPRRLESFTLS